VAVVAKEVAAMAVVAWVGAEPGWAAVVVAAVALAAMAWWGAGVEAGMLVGAAWVTGTLFETTGRRTRHWPA
jgi:hypothetical protein